MIVKWEKSKIRPSDKSGKRPTNSVLPKPPQMHTQNSSTEAASPNTSPLDSSIIHNQNDFGFSHLHCNSSSSFITEDETEFWLLIKYNQNDKVNVSCNSQTTPIDKVKPQVSPSPLNIIANSIINRENKSTSLENLLIVLTQLGWSDMKTLVEKYLFPRLHIILSNIEDFNFIKNLLLTPPNKQCQNQKTFHCNLLLSQTQMINYLYLIIIHSKHLSDWLWLPHGPYFIELIFPFLTHDNSLSLVNFILFNLKYFLWGPHFLKLILYFINLGHSTILTGVNNWLQNNFIYYGTHANTSLVIITLFRLNIPSICLSIKYQVSINMQSLLSNITGYDWVSKLVPLFSSRY